MNKFKIGDKVVVVDANSSEGHYKNGDIGIVSRISHSLHGYVIRDDGQPMNVYWHEIEHYNEKEKEIMSDSENMFVVGDVVTRISHEGGAREILFGCNYKVEAVDGNYVRVHGSTAYLWWDRFALARVLEPVLNLERIVCKPLEKEMNVEQMRDEVVRIDKRIEEANKDIANAQKEREALVGKIREKGFVLADEKPNVTNDSERFKVGEYVMIIGNYSGHCFDVNQIVTIKMDEGDHYFCESGSESWFVSDTDLVKI